MKIRNAVVAGASCLTGLGLELSKEAKQRLKWFDPDSIGATVIMLVLPVATSTSLHPLSTAGNIATILSA